MNTKLRELVQKTIEEHENELLEAETAEQERIEIQRQKDEMNKKQMAELVEQKYDNAKKFPTARTFCR